jgi:hypothetical protein
VVVKFCFLFVFYFIFLIGFYMSWPDSPFHSSLYLLDIVSSSKDSRIREIKTLEQRSLQCNINTDQ